MAEGKKEIELIDKIDLTQGKEAVKAQIKKRKETLDFFIENEKAIAKAKAK